MLKIVNLPPGMRVEWTMSGAARDVLAERRRQVTAEGWSPGNDDMHHGDGSLAMVAALYAAPSDDLMIVKADALSISAVDPWPGSWSKRWDKRRQHARRKRLVIAGALILAEIERMDRREDALACRPPLPGGGLLARAGAWLACQWNPRDGGAL